MILNSIRWRLQAWHSLILTVIVIGFSITAYQLDYAQRLRRVDNELQELTYPKSGDGTEGTHAKAQRDRLLNALT